MLKALWTTITGNWVWLAAGAIALSVAFGGGYYTAVNQIEKVQVVAAQKAAVAQEKHDVDEHKAAVVTSDAIGKTDAAHADKVRTIIQRIHDAEGVSIAPVIQMPDSISLSAPQNNCDLSPDVAKLLNEAGHYTPVE